MKWRLTLAGLLFIAAAAGQIQDPSAVLNDVNYNYKVKQINDFIDRFNFNRNGDFYQYLKTERPEEFRQTSRPDFIESLFNSKGAVYQKPEVKRFITQAVKNNHYLDLHRSDMYAMLICSFRRNNKPITIRIALELQTNEEDHSSKWVICGVLSKELDPLRNVDTTKFMHSSSHGTDFIGIDRILSDKTNLPAYFVENYRPGTIAVFIDEIKSGKLKFVQVNDVQYHFLQVPGWVFVVSQLHRDSKNSGWLITKLYSNPDSEKNIYRMLELGIK